MTVDWQDLSKDRLIPRTPMLKERLSTCRGQFMLDTCNCWKDLETARCGYYWWKTTR